MTITGYTSGYNATVLPEGKLDANSAPQLEKYLQQIDPFIKEVTLDLMKLTYISSMGLRVILQAYKNLTKHRKRLKVVNISENIRDVFEMTGFIQSFIEDEKLVILKKEENSSGVAYALTGDLAPETFSLLDPIIKELKAGDAKDVVILCDGLNSISHDGCADLKNLWDVVNKKGRSLRLKNVNKTVLAAIKDFGFKQSPEGDVSSFTASQEASG